MITAPIVILLVLAVLAVVGCAALVVWLLRIAAMAAVPVPLAAWAPEEAAPPGIRIGICCREPQHCAPVPPRHRDGALSELSLDEWTRAWSTEVAEGERMRLLERMDAAEVAAVARLRQMRATGPGSDAEQ